MIVYYKVQQILLQNAAAISLQNATEVYYKMPQVFYYKIRQFYYAAVYNATFITNCGSTIMFVLLVRFILCHLLNKEMKLSETYKPLSI